MTPPDPAPKANLRPRSVTVISWAFIVLGTVSLLASLMPPTSPAAAQHVAEFRSQYPVEYAVMYLNLVVAILCGAFMLRGRNWARWLTVLWFGRNIINQMHYSTLLGWVPALLFGYAAYCLFRPPAMAYFRGTNTQPPDPPAT